MIIWSSELKEVKRLHDSSKGQHLKLDKELEKLVKTDDENMVLVYARRCLEVIITDLCERELKRDRGTEPLKGIIDKLNKEKKVPHNIIVSMQNLNSLSSFGAHPKDFDPRQVKPVLLDLVTVLEWYLKHLDSKMIGASERSQDTISETKHTYSRNASTKPGKKIVYLAGGFLTCAIIIILLIVFDIIGGGKKSFKETISSIVVLPFSNFTGTDTLDIFLSGMHSALIQDMGKVGSLQISGSTTSKVFKDVDMTLKQITSELNVDAALETDVTCSGDSICMSIRLYQTRDEEKQVWTGDFKEAKSKIQNLFNSITKQIANDIAIELSSDELQRLSEFKTVNPAAYEAYLKGNYYWDQFTPEALQLALEYYNKAIEIDQDWAPPYAGIAYFWIAIRQFGLAPPSVSIPNIYRGLNKALELDPNSGFVHYVNALTAYATEFDWDKSEIEFLKALEINPNDAFSHMYYAHLLSTLRRNDEALSHCQSALELDPKNPMIQSLSSLVLANAGQFDDALSIIDKALSIVPKHPVALSNLFGIYAVKGEYRSFIEIWAGTFQFEPDVCNSILETFDQHGLETAMKEFITVLEAATGDHFPLDLGQANILAGDKAKGLDWYLKAYEERNPMMIYITTFHFTEEPYKINDPRFDSLLIKMNLPLTKTE